MPKIVKNTTNLDIDLDTGITVPANGQYTLNHTEYLDWAQDIPPGSVLETLILAGDIIVNTGTGDLAAADGVEYLRYPDNAKGISFDGSTTVHQSILNAGGGSSALLGSIHQLVYLENSTAKKEWLQLYGDNFKGSNKTPGLVVWKSELVGLSFANERNGADTDIEIHVSSEGDGNSPTTKIFTWAVRDARVGRKTNFSPAIVFESGDKIGLYVKDQGKDPKDIAVILYLKVIAVNSEESIEDYSGDFGTTGTGTSSSGS